MKKLLVVVIVLLVFQKWGSIRNFINPPPDYAAAHDGKVILYATSWCKYCAAARTLLEHNNIPYHEYDLDKSKDGRVQVKRLGGGRIIPVLLINGKVVKGYKPKEILELIKKK